MRDTPVPVKDTGSQYCAVLAPEDNVLFAVLASEDNAVLAPEDNAVFAALDRSRTSATTPQRTLEPNNKAKSKPSYVRTSEQTT